MIMTITNHILGTFVNYLPKTKVRKTDLLRTYLLTYFSFFLDIE